MQLHLLSTLAVFGLVRAQFYYDYYDENEYTSGDDAPAGKQEPTEEQRMLKLAHDVATEIGKSLGWRAIVERGNDGARGLRGKAASKAKETIDYDSIVSDSSVGPNDTPEGAGLEKSPGAAIAISGMPGPRGHRGHVGPAGRGGNPGSGGPRGPIGPRGPKGPSGDPGPRGYIGQIGPAGLKGPCPNLIRMQERN